MPSFAIALQVGSKVTSADSTYSLCPQEYTGRYGTYITIRAGSKIAINVSSDMMEGNTGLSTPQWIATVVIMLLGFGCSSNKDVSLSETVKFEPAWDVDVPAPMESDSVSRVFHFLWDQSIPLGGHVHRTDPDSQDALQIIDRLLKSARSISDYRGDSLKCLGITNSIMPIDCKSSLSRSFFAGGVSRLDQGVEYILDGLTNGTFKGAALITDLITTTSYGTGATALLPYLTDPTLKAYYKAGKIDVALIGVRMDYWGVHSGTCQALPGPLGCWFNETQNRYHPLVRTVKRPIYVLLMGWRTKEGGRRKNPVHNMATAFFNSLTALEFEAKHETFALGYQDEFTWRLDKKGSQPVSLDQEHGYYCKASRTYPFFGEFSDTTTMVSSVHLVDDKEIINQNKSESDSTRINLGLNCEELLKRIRQNDCADIRSSPPRVEVRIKNKHNDVWDEWSSDKDSSSLTIGLNGFIKGLRPDYYKRIVTPKLNLQECRN